MLEFFAQVNFVIFTKKATAKFPFAVAFFMPVRIDKYSALYYNSIIVL